MNFNRGYLGHKFTRIDADFLPQRTRINTDLIFYGRTPLVFLEGSQVHEVFSRSDPFRTFRISSLNSVSIFSISSVRVESN